MVGNAAPRQRLQRSFSLDDTKTKMASCIITSVLSKKMQVEQNTCKTSYLQRKAALLPAPPQRVREAAGVFRAPVHVVRDVRSLVKNTHSLSFSSATSDNKPASFKVIGQDASPPPTYQQAVGHDETKRRCPASSRGRVAKVAASLSQSQDRQQSASRPMTQQRRGSEPSRGQVDDVTWPVDPPPVSSDLSEVSQSEGGRGVSHQAGTSLQPPVSAQEQSPILGVSSQSAPQQILHPCFYTPTALPAFPPTLHPHLGQVGYLHTPLSYIQTRPVPVLHWSTGNTSDQLDHVNRTGPPPWTLTAGDQESSGNTVMPAARQQHEQLQQQRTLQPQFLCTVQGFLPAQVGSDFLADITGAAVLSGPAPCHMILDPKSGRYFYVATPPPPQRKLLLDPETGQFIKVFLPAARSTPNAGVLLARCAINPAPAVLSVMPFQPTVGVPSLYAAPCLPFARHTPAANM